MLKRNDKALLNGDNLIVLVEYPNAQYYINNEMLTLFVNNNGKNVTLSEKTYFNVIFSEIFKGIPVLRSENLDMTIRILVYLYGYLDKVGNPSFHSKIDQRGFLRMLPGVGNILSERLLREYGNIYNVVINWDKLPKKAQEFILKYYYNNSG